MKTRKKPSERTEKVVHDGYTNQQVAYLSPAAWKYGIYQALGEHSC
jgi:hypothetical protein